MNQRILLIIAIILFCNIANSQIVDYTLSDDSVVNRYASQEKAYYATRTEIVPKIDGKLDDECWKQIGSWDGGFIQQQPHQAKAPSQETEIKILYDNKYLYFAIICHDTEPDKMSPILGRRDENNGDVAGIAIDSYNDNQTAFEFNLTAAGQKIDLMHRGEYNWDFNWDAVWDGKTSLGDSAWYAEMRVPFTQLRFSNEKEHVWGIHVWRWIHRLSEESQWKLIPIDAPAMVYIFGELKGIKDIPYKRNFELMPYVKAKYVPENSSSENFGGGLDGKIGVTSDFTLDYTFNPDFGQVEADPSVLNLTSYETFREEKRPFFLEGKNILEYNTGTYDELYYSRRIGDSPSYSPNVEDKDISEMPENNSIINALKLTGKNKNGLSLGLVNSMTAKENVLINTGSTEEEKTVEPFTNYFVGRVKQDLNNGSTVLGGIVTSTIRNIKDEHLEFLPDNSIVGGLDVEHNWLNRKYFVSGKSFYSKVNGNETAISRLQRSSRHLYQRTDADHLEYDSDLTTLKGWGGDLSGGKRSGKLQIDAKLDWRSPGVDFNDVGYMRQADYVKQDFGILYQVNTPKGIFLNYFINLDQRHHWSYGGENLKDELDGHFSFRLKNYWKFNLDIDRTYNEIDTRQLRGGPSLRIDGNTSGEIFVQTNRSKDLYFFGGVDITRYDDQITKSNDYTFGFQWMISNRISISSRSNFVDEIDNSQYVFQKVINDKREYVVGQIDRNTIFTTIRAEYFITPELSLQYYGSPYASTGKYLDYRNVEDSKSKNLDERYSLLKVVENEEDKFLYDDNGNLYHDFKNWDPDFNFQEFSSNFVARWEYKTGSTVYFVWTNYRSNYEDGHDSSIASSLKGISKVEAQNAFMIKLSYWFSL